MTETSKSQQYLRTCKLIVADNSVNGLDLSNLRIKFQVKRSDTLTPNTADIRVYNVEEQTALRIRTEFKRVVLQCGYPGNEGVIFQGNIKQVIWGWEGTTDSFIDIIAGDGDRAYNFSVVSQTLAAGASQNDQLKAVATAMQPKGVTLGHVGELAPTKLPRGKVLYGDCKSYLTNLAEDASAQVSIQDEKITFVPNKSYLPGEVVVLTNKTGLLDAPQQTNEGVNAKCLLNPNLKTGGRVQLDAKAIQRFKIDLNQPNSAKSIPAPLNANGVYYILVVEHSGDTRGPEWVSKMICLNNDVSANPRNSVQVGYGG